MYKNILFYITAFTMLGFVLIFFNGVSSKLNNYAEMTTRHNTVHSGYQHLSRLLDNAAIPDADLARAKATSKTGRLFFADSAIILQQLVQLKSVVRDSVNIDIVGKLDRHVRSELPWLLSNNLPDSFKPNQSAAHIIAFRTMDSLMKKGIARTLFLIEYRRHQWEHEMVKLKFWTLLFISLSFLLLIYTTANLINQKSQRKIKETELELVLNRIRDGVVSVNENWHYTFLNDAALSTHPLGRSATMGRNIWDVHPEMEGTIFWDKYHEAMETKKVTHIESYYEPMDIWFSVTVYPSENGLTIFFKDVTENKKAADKMAKIRRELTEAAELVAKSEKIYKTIASNIPGSVICLLDPDYRFLLIEGDMLAKLGYSKDFLLGNKAIDVLSPDTYAGVVPRFQSAFRGDPVMFESSHDGYDLISRYIPLRDDNSQIDSIMTVTVDVSDLKKALQDLAVLNRGLEEKIITRTRQLKKSNDEMEAFCYSVSHDLRSPLRGIIGFSTILEEDYAGCLDAEGKRIIDVIKKNTLRMGDLIDDLLSFSRMGKQHLSKTSVDTCALIAEIVGEQMQQKANKKISWNIQVLPEVMADIKTFRQVWMNLISNAIKYSGNREHPEIGIGYYEDEGQHVFHIRDNGAGFNETYKNKLFKVFQRLHSIAEFEGTGVGLAIVEKIISRHGGRVWAEGKEDQGACFYFSIPF